MGFFGKKKSHDDDYVSYDRSSSGRDLKKTKKKKKKMKKKSSPIEDGYPREGKSKKIKRLKRMLGGKKSKKSKKNHKGGGYDDRQGGGAMYDDRPNRRRGRSRDDDEDYDEYEDDYQLDDVDDDQSRDVVERIGGGGDSRRFRVKPFNAFAEPVFMNEAELYQVMTQPSDEFDFLTSYLNPSTKATRRVKVPDQVRRYFGSPREDGRIGSIRVEVLGCVGMDRAKPEVSVYMVVGDCAFASDVIAGCRSPMFPPSAKRAAVFPIHHAYARLFVGVFDLKANKKSEQDHFCGRVAIDIPPIRPDTEYDCTFPIRSSTFIYDRRPRGVIRLRFSLHWFSERAAIMSYLKRPRNPLAFSRQAKKQPTIPCGDPKTFRNVAVAVHGQDFPGKYTRGAFRATMREFNLYQQNLRYLAKVTIVDCILWENPLMSLYLFSTNLYCVYLNSVRLVPPFFIGWLIYMLFENYLANNMSVAGNLGYKPPSIMEVFMGLIRDGKGTKFNFKPVSVKKRPRRQVLGEDGKLTDIELANHREFPFSERFTYPKFAASDAIAAGPAKNVKKGKKGAIAVAAKDDGATARRLSIYTTPQDSKDDASVAESSSEEEESERGERDEEGMMDQGDGGYGEMGDSDDEDDDSDNEDAPQTGKGRIFQSGKASMTRRIRVGPEQNSDKSGQKKPPQVHLSRVEHMLHRATKNISVEHVHFPPPTQQVNLGKDYNAKGPAGDVMTAKEKQNFDEFDRMLGFRTKNPNPILRITSSFLGPLMRIIRIVVYATRIGFNVTAWTDPYLTFWVFSFLCTLAFILFIFPWRTFFLVSTIILLGPQNVAVRKYLERRAREKEIENAEKAEREKEEAKRRGDDMKAQQEALAAKKEQEEKEKKKKKGGFFGNRKDDVGDDAEEVTDADLFHSPRPAFYAHTRPTRRTQLPRDVAVPYFRFRKERFFDWPPDPTVSRATPLLAGGNGRHELGGSVHAGRRGRSNSYDEYSDEDEYFDEDDDDEFES